MVLWAFSNLVVQCQTKALDDRLSEPYGVRAEGWIRLTTCQPNRVQASSLLWIPAGAADLSPETWDPPGGQLAAIPSRVPIPRKSSHRPSPAQELRFKGAGVTRGYRTAPKSLPAHPRPSLRRVPASYWAV
jgi:hypothetical protein